MRFLVGPSYHKIFKSTTQFKVRPLTFVAGNHDGVPLQGAVFIGGEIKVRFSVDVSLHSRL